MPPVSTLSHSIQTSKSTRAVYMLGAKLTRANNKLPSLHGHTGGICLELVDKEQTTSYTVKHWQEDSILDLEPLRNGILNTEVS